MKFRVSLPITIMLVAVWSGPVCAGGSSEAGLGDLILRDQFSPPIQPIFGSGDDGYTLPPGPTADQLAWILSELQAGETTTLAEVQAHFIPGFEPVDFFGSLRDLFPNAVITDVVTVTPTTLTVVIEADTGSSPKGYLSVSANYTGAHLISSFGVSNYFGSVQYVEDQNLTMAQALDKYETVAQQTSFLVARINSQDQCVPIEDRNASTLRGTGSIFKIWVLGGVASAIENGTITGDDLVEVVASELALAGSINDLVGTLFTVDDLAQLMLGISDNTATDLLHEYATRTTVNTFVDVSGVADPDILKPLLSINEQFHLYFSFPLAMSLSYIDGTEAFQQDYLENEIVPLGPVTSFPFANPSILDDGTWQASPMDICQTFATLRKTPTTNGAYSVADRALSAGIAQPELRGKFDRVWSKGGSLSDNNGYRVYTLSWLLETNGGEPYVVVAMANNANTGDVDPFVVQSLTSRVIQLIAESQ